MSDERKKYIRSVTIRVSCYPIIPIVTQLMVVIANLAPASPYWLFVLANITPSTQGILNFLVYIMNPALDMYRRRYTKRILGIRHKKRFGKLEESEDTVDLYPSVSHPDSIYSSHKDHSFKYESKIV
ncbi:hypothetical protein H4R99_003300 [Coemansia sp. RSA 1722]|nr:hypothetical protein H4R99_003300 [Coemansia sp. RSA 1722]